MAWGKLWTFCGVAVLLVPLAVADTPANCTYADMLGTWVFSVSQGGNDKTLDCTDPGPATNNITVQFSHFSTATVMSSGGYTFDVNGYWTLIYNQGFEFRVLNRKFFAFFKWTGEGKNATSMCNEIMPGWSHDVLGKDWACFQGMRIKPEQKPRQPTPAVYHSEAKERRLQQNYKTNLDFIDQINGAQSSWQAGVYPEYEKFTHEDLIRRAGGKKSRLPHRPRPAPVTEETRLAAAQLPESFDWRKVMGLNFVSPVRNQEQCGSCYSFASMGMLEARLRVLTNNTQQVVLSPQEVVSCGKYSQGCEGGFPYLIAGKYAEDFGVVLEDCYPYEGKDSSCKDTSKCRRGYATNYRYVGGFYGGCNEELMQLELVKNGPMAVAFEVYDDFLHYKGGIYEHTGLRDPFNPFEITNHAVLLVGYGRDLETGAKFWTVKNSWGESWGEEGFFRIRRGMDECAIESIAVAADPIPLMS
ncbi:PREDICTED: dipeptidyl peptidase 1-like isoform X1 [Branchiostoma belcheri]|uniref:Dipeptidyl peptidase 1 n=1 Tax=Branchiostoma belcheri TaxID=7741 RepID=A0A6P4ZDD8_BRABE|nr:PREDICTED: dipeptidyl peptidase 1-like isoform X1 [Branchiostoma belcheri]